MTDDQTPDQKLRHWRDKFAELRASMREVPLYRLRRSPHPRIGIAVRYGYAGRYGFRTFGCHRQGFDSEAAFTDSQICGSVLI